jgi:hypothetical protein
MNVALNTLYCQSNNLTSLNIMNNKPMVQGINLRLEGNPGTWWIRLHN